MKNHNGSGECGVSISDDVLQKVIFGKTVRQHLEEEKVAIRWREDREGIKQMIDKKEVMKVLGHSADFILALIYRFSVDKVYKKMPEDKVRKLANFLSFKKYKK